MDFRRVKLRSVRFLTNNSIIGSNELKAAKKVLRKIQTPKYYPQVY